MASYATVITKPTAVDNGPSSDLLGSGPDPLYVILTSCLPHLSALDLVYITCSSKTLGQVCEARLREGNREAAHLILRECVAQAAVTFVFDDKTNYYQTRNGLRVEPSSGEVELVGFPQPKGLQRSYKALQWLIRKSGGDFFDPADRFGPETARALLHTSNVPGPHAVALVAAGFRMSYEQFVTAARSSVRGLRVWVAAHRNLEVDSGLPEYVEDMLVGLVANQATEVSKGWQWVEVCKPPAGGAPQVKNFSYILMNSLEAL
jgi:hypothetical protein